MIREYVADHPEIEIVSEKVDDGYSGVNFERPGFQEMMEEIRDRKVDCVIVKDLSRFGRNYIEAGNYLEKIFPLMGVRFIAINDYYDSSEKNQSDSLIIPFKNLINDAYCKDISVKIRTQLEIKRKKGQYTGAVPIYGYMKDPEDHNHLIPDPEAAEVVRSIFQMKMQGMSIGRIMKKLDAEGIPGPMEYKLAKGVGVSTVLRTYPKALWSYNAIKRILQNEIYIGNLVQGKSSSPNHKIKKLLPKKKEEWIRVEGTHEPIVDEFVFWNVQVQMKKDLYTAPGRSTVYPFCGLLTCADCGQNMIRKTAPWNGKKYIYYKCGSYIAGRGCTTHSIRVEKLEEAVLEAIRARVAAVCDMTDIVNSVGQINSGKLNMGKYDRQVVKLQDEIEQYQKYKRQLYESLQEGTISKKDYEIFRRNYDDQIERTEAAICHVTEEKEAMIKNEVKDFSWMRKFRKYRNISELDRVVVVELIDHIVIGEGERVEIHFRNEDEFKLLHQTIELLAEDVTENKPDEKQKIG
jgi:DNA invertase Pin-like site-specific DNA recombinase